jgi:hypothetical protein
LFLIWSPGPTCLQIHTQDMYGLHFGRSSYAWRPWVRLKLDSDKINIECRLTLKAASHWGSTHGQMKTYSHWCGYWKMIFYVIILFIKIISIYRALDKFTWQTLDGYWWGLVPWVSHKLDSNRINMESWHESVNQQGFFESYFLLLWLEIQPNSRWQNI